jgi:hypothetical protein
MLIFGQALIKFFSQNQGQKAAKHVAGDARIK